MTTPEFEASDAEPNGDIQQSPDDLMDLSIEELAFKLVSRVRRLKKIQKAKGPEWLQKRERQLIRVSEVACRVRIREMARWIYREIKRKG